MNRAMTPTELGALSPAQYEAWRVQAGHEVSQLCRTAITTGVHPGVIGGTDPTSAAAVAEVMRARTDAPTSPPWTLYRIETWRDRAIDAVHDILLDTNPGYTPGAAATAGLGLCDLRVRDVIVHDLLTASPHARAEAGRRLWPITETLPDVLRAPAGTVLAITEYTAGRDVSAILDWATEATPDYRLAALLTEVSRRGIPPTDWAAAMSTLSVEQCRYGSGGGPVTSPVDPLAAATDPAVNPTDLGGPQR